MHPSIAFLCFEKIKYDNNHQKQIDWFIGSASIVKVRVPKEILNQLNIDPDIFSHVLLILTCAHNVVYLDLKEDKLK